MERQQMRNQNIAKGFLSLSIAKVVFMISGFVIYFSLPRILSPAEFGNYGVIIGFVSIFNMMLVVGNIQAVSKFVSEKPGIEPAIRAAAFRAQTLIGGSISLGLFFSADFIAYLFKDPSLALPIRIISAMPCLYSFYAVVMGSLNGRGLYQRQATLDITFAILKTSLIIAGAVLMGNVLGALSGFTVTSLLIMIIGLVYIRSDHKEISIKDYPESHKRFSVKDLLRFEVSVMILTLLCNLLINMDLFMVKALVSAETSAELAGYYTAVQTFARIPYVLVVALALVMFPLISKSTFANDMNQCRRYIKSAFRFPLIIIAPIAIFISAYARDCMALVYPDPYSVAAPALVILALAELFLAMFYLATTIINSSGSPGLSIGITVVAITFHAGACWLLIPEYGLKGAAIASVIGWLMGFLCCGVYLFYRFKTLLSPLTVMRTTAAMVLTWFAATHFPFTGVYGTAVGIVFTLCVYWGILLTFREISIPELKSLMRKIL